MSKCINVRNLHLAEVKITKENGQRKFEFGTPELVLGLMKVEQVPQVATGTLQGDGKQREKISKRNGYELAIDHNKLPKKWRDYIEGTTTVNGVQSDKGKCEPRPFAMGWVSDHIDDGVTSEELTWFIDCMAEPIEDTYEQQEEKDIKISNDTMKVTCFKVDEFDNRAFTKIDTADSEVTEEMIDNFFKQVQTTDIISAPNESDT